MKFRKYLAIVLVFAMMISNVSVAVAKEQKNLDKNGITEVHNIELENGAEIRIEEDGDKRIAEYYVNGVKKQLAVFNKNTDDIYYYDLSRKNVSTNVYPADNRISPESYTIRYNIQDFMQGETNNVISSSAPNGVSTYSSNDFKYLKSKTFTDSGLTYKRYLYGYTDSKQYKKNSWHFPVGTALSVIAAVCGYLNPVAKVIGSIATVAGLIITAFTVQEWIKELFWVYKFQQTSPNVLEAVVNRQFTYEKQRKVEINGDEGYWETIEKEEQWEIEFTRNDILTYPGSYLF